MGTSQTWRLPGAGAGSWGLFNRQFRFCRSKKGWRRMAVTAAQLYAYKHNMVNVTLRVFCYDDQFFKKLSWKCQNHFGGRRWQPHS